MPVLSIFTSAVAEHCLIATTAISGPGSGITSLDAGNISAGTLAIARGGTNQTSFTSNGIVYFDGTRQTSSSNLLYSGGDIQVTSGSYLLSSTNEGVGMTNAYFTFTSATSINGGISGTDYFRVVASGSGTSDGNDTGILIYAAGSLRAVKIGASDSCGSGYRCLKVAN